MEDRPSLHKGLDSETFRQHYYLKEELVAFCREMRLPVSGGKMAIAERIAHYLDTGEVLPAKSPNRAQAHEGDIVEDAVIAPGFVCTERHRAFFLARIGKGFSFNTAFQGWLKGNAGKTYGDAVAAYYEILKEKKSGKTEIGRQFEYNTYIRAFFAGNKGKTLDDAIACWRYKKGVAGHNRYEDADLVALEK